MSGANPPTHPVPLIPSRPVHLNWRFVGLVALGGMLGTAAREGLSLAVPAFSTFPFVIFGINVVGAFALGLLLEALALRGADRGIRRMLRLGAGTGVLGGFTTYSTFAVGAVGLLEAGSVWIALCYGLGTVVVGAAATLLGVVVATHWRHRSAETEA